MFLYIAAGLLALAALTGTKTAEPPTPEPKKGKKYSKEFVLASGRWLKENKPPEDWEGSKLQYAESEMPFEGDVYQ